VDRVDPDESCLTVGGGVELPDETVPVQDGQGEISQRRFVAGLYISSP
jgi:hypothetical protein